MGFPSAVLVRQGQSITGSFNRIQCFASGSASTANGHISALKDGNGNAFSLGTTGATGLFLPPGTVMDLVITSASLDTTSAPIMFFTI
jgi:hypothetical protein